MQWKHYLVLVCIFSVSQMSFALDVFVRQQPFATCAAKVGIEPTLTDAAQRMYGCFRGR